MVYEYHCGYCARVVDVVKSIREIDNPEKCGVCGSQMARAFAPRRIHLSGTAVQEKKWQPALGRAATDNELKAAARSNDWIEVGNEKPDKHLKPQLAEYPSFTDDDLRSMQP